MIREGSSVKALRAFTAIPGIFRPFRWRDRILVDGGWWSRFRYGPAGSWERSS